MTLDLFPETMQPRARAKARVLMHVVDAGQVEHGRPEDLGKPLCRLSCKRCEAESDWLIFNSITEAKRGIPCEACNADQEAPDEIA